jgi:hypothetical protein
MVKHRRKSRKRKSLKRKSRKRKSRKRKSRKRKSRKRKSIRRRKSRKRKSIRRRKSYGGAMYRHVGKIDAFCGKDSILKEAYRSCDDRLLVSIEIKNSANAIMEAFGHIPMGFGKFTDDNGKIDEQNAQEWILNKIKTTAVSAMDEITVANSIVLKGFYSKKIDQQSNKDEGTLVFTNSDILLDDAAPAKLENKYPKKKEKRDPCDVEPHCYRFNKGIGPIALKSALEQQDANKKFILLEASGDNDLVKMYQTLYGFGDPVRIQYTDFDGESIIMYATISDVIETINSNIE